MNQQPPSVGAGPPPPPPPPPPHPQFYGQAQYPGQPMLYATAPSTNGVGVAGGVVGIVAVVLFWFPFIGAILGIIAVSLGGVGLQRAKQMGGSSKGMSVTGIVCGSVALVLNILIFVSIIVGHSHLAA